VIRAVWLSNLKTVLGAEAFAACLTVVRAVTGVLAHV